MRCHEDTLGTLNIKHVFKNSAPMGQLSIDRTKRVEKNKRKRKRPKKADKKQTAAPVVTCEVSGRRLTIYVLY